MRGMGNSPIFIALCIDIGKSTVEETKYKRKIKADDHHSKSLLCLIIHKYLRN